MKLFAAREGWFWGFLCTFELTIACCASGYLCRLQAWLEGGCKCVLKHSRGSSYGSCVHILPEMLREVVSRPSVKQLEEQHLREMWSMLYFWTLQNCFFSATEVPGNSIDTSWAFFTVFAFHKCSKRQLCLLTCIRNFKKLYFLLLLILTNLSSLAWNFPPAVCRTCIFFMFMLKIFPHLWK